jgi:hypothetical protein
MNAQQKYLQAAESERQKMVLFAERYITRRPNRSNQAAEDVIVMSVRDAMVMVADVVRAQFCVVNTPVEICAGILLRSNADLLFNLEINPWWQQHKHMLIGPLQMAVSSAYDAIEGNDLDSKRTMIGTLGDLCGIIVNLHHGFDVLRQNSRSMKADLANIYL